MVTLFVLATMLALTVFVPSPATATSSGSGGTNSVSHVGLLPGDIILGENPGTKSSKLVPGKYSHAMMYCGVVRSGEKYWDRTNGRWLAVGEPYIIHSTPDDDDSKDGLGYDSWYTRVNGGYENLLVLRVMKSGGVPLTDSERSQVVNFLRSKLSGGKDGYPVGPKYDYNWLRKGVNPPYYCSEAVWAAYKSVLGIDLDADTSPFNIGVSPDDLWHSQYTSVIAGEDGSSRWSARYGVCKVSVYVYKIHYKEDKDPWLKGAGEMYLKSFTGDSQYPTEEGYPGCGKIGRTPDGTWPRNGAGDLYWRKDFYSFVNYYRYLKIRIEAWEDDSTDGDDQFDPYQIVWSPTTWHSKIGAGYQYYPASKSDCIYYIYIRITWAYDPVGGGGGGGGGTPVVR